MHSLYQSVCNIDKIVTNILKLFCANLSEEKLKAKIKDAVSQLNGAKFIYFFDTLLAESFNQDTIDQNHVLEYLINLREKELAIHVPNFKQMVALYRYYMFGEYAPCGSGNGTQLFDSILRGVHALHDDDLESARKYLEAALKLRNKDKVLKNVFDNPVTCYFLMALYARCNSRTRESKLRAFLNKSAVGAGTNFGPAYTVAMKESGKPFKSVESRISGLVHYTRRRNAHKAVHLMAQCLCKNYGIDLPENSEGDVRLPAYAVLRHEFQHVLPLSAEECAQLNENFGQPAYMREKPTERWEMALNELERAYCSVVESEAKSEVSDQRLIYLIPAWNSYYLNMRLQKRLKNGNWSVGKLVNPVSFSSLPQEALDDVDCSILQKNDYYLRFVDVIPKLVGSDRVFSEGSDNQWIPVKVEEEKPYFIFEKGEKNFKISSNLAGGTECDGSKCVIVRKSQSHYVVCPLTPEVQTFLKQVKDLPPLPLAAEEQLKRLLLRVAEKVEIHSDILEGEAALTIIKGAPHIVARITPGTTENSYLVEFLAKPCAAGRTYFTPGKAPVTVIDEVDGRRCRVKRNLKQESQNCEELHDFMAETCGGKNPSDMEEGFCGFYASTEELLFLLEYLQADPERFSAEWPEGGTFTVHPKPVQTAWNIQLKDRAGWFDIEGEVKIDERRTLSIAELLQQVGKSSSRFIRLGSSDFLALTESLRRQLARLESISVKERGEMHIPAGNACLLTNALQGGELQVSGMEGAEALSERIHQSFSLRPQTPRGLDATLRDYQLEGFRWMKRLDSWGAGACLADDMGLGKTVQTIALLLSKATEGPSLVVAPTSVVSNWMTEIERFAPSLRPVIINALGAEGRAAIIIEAGKSDVVLTTYGILSGEQPELLEKAWNVVVLDEAHSIKNRDTKMAHAACRLQAASRVALTGTPLQNRLDELWSLFNFLNPGLLGGFDAFREKFVRPIEEEQNDERRSQLRRIITPFILRRTKAEVMEELPDKTEIIRHIELSPDEMHAYELLRVRAQEQLEAEGKVSVSVLAEITRLRQAACAAQLADPKLNFASTKITELLDLTDELRDTNSRVLIFSQFTSFLALVKKALEQHGVDFLYLDGTTPLKQRAELVRRFQAGECPFFVISLKAGGLGLNLTAANCVIHMDPWWNPAIEQQATDRAYRMGQQQRVTVYHLIAEHTIEEKILRLHRTKRDLADSLLEGTAGSYKLTEKDLMEMLQG